SDIGRPVTDIKPNVKTPDLRQAIQRTIDSLEIQEFRVEDGDGRWYSMRIRPYRTLDNKIDGVVMVLLDIESRRAKQPCSDHDPIIPLLAEEGWREAPGWSVRRKRPPV